MYFVFINEISANKFEKNILESSKMSGLLFQFIEYIIMQF